MTAKDFKIEKCACPVCGRLAHEAVGELNGMKI